MQGGSRIVVDATGPVRIDKAFVLEPVDGQPARLVLDLVVDRPRELHAHSRARGKAAPRAGNQARRSRQAPQRRPPADRASIRAMAAPTPAPSRRAARWKRRSCWNSPRRCREKLEKSGKYRVAMTRTDDRFVPLGERVRMARSQGAALFVSIHADALAARREADVRGATVYTVSDTASDDEAARLAEDENKADAIAGVDLSSEPEEVADILIDLTQRETKNFSAHFARAVVGELKTAAQAAQASAEVRGLQGAQGPGCSLGADRARLCVEQAGPEADDLGRLARAHRGRAGAGGEYLLLDPARGFRSRAGRELRCDDEACGRPGKRSGKPQV